MNRRECLKVAIDAQTIPGKTGGVAPFLACLIHALGQLGDGSEFYTIIVRSPQQVDWLQPFLGPNQRLVIKTKPANPRLTFPGVLKGALGPLLPAARRIQQTDQRSTVLA